MLSVAVERDDVVAGRGVEPGAKRGLMAEVAAEMKRADAAVAFGDPVQPFFAPVA